MAIDNENKRRSAGQFPIIPIYPVADGAIAGRDRAHAAWLYRALVAIDGAESDHLMLKGMGGELQ